jgi:hypothetical protein
VAQKTKNKKQKWHGGMAASHPSEDGGVKQDTTALGLWNAKKGTKSFRGGVSKSPARQ